MNTNRSMSIEEVFCRKFIDGMERGEKDSVAFKNAVDLVSMRKEFRDSFQDKLLSMLSESGSATKKVIKKLCKENGINFPSENKHSHIVER